MSMRSRAALAAVSLLVSPLAVAAVATPAEAAGVNYRNCTALTRDFKHGVAKNAASAQRQVRQGYGRPATTRRAKKVYWANYRSMDRDRDGTACER